MLIYTYSNAYGVRAWYVRKGRTRPLSLRRAIWLTSLPQAKPVKITEGRSPTFRLKSGSTLQVFEIAEG